MQTSTEWTIDEMFSCMKERFELDDIKEIGDDLWAHPVKVAKAVARKIEAYINEQAEEKGLCPQCLAQLGAIYERQCLGHCGDEPAYADIPVVSVCTSETCDYREAL